MEHLGTRELRLQSVLLKLSGACDLPWDLVKMQILFKWVWDRVWDSAFLTSSGGNPMLLMDYSMSTESLPPWSEFLCFCKIPKWVTFRGCLPPDVKYGVSFPAPILQFYWHNSLFRGSVLFRHYVLGVSLGSHRLKFSVPQECPYFWRQLKMRWVPTTLLQFPWLAGMSHRTPGKHFTYCYWIWIKDTTLAQSNGRDVWSKVCGKRCRHSLPSPLPAPRCAPQPKLSEPIFQGFLWKLHYVDMIDAVTGHWWLNSVYHPPLPSW